MIRHIVLVRFAAAIDETERSAVMADLAALQQSVPGILSFTGGTNVSREGRSAGFTHGFVMDFTDEAARDAYLSHPAHEAAAAKLVAAADGDSGITVIDLIVD